MSQGSFLLAIAIGLASWAVTRLWIYEYITAPVRGWLVPKLPRWRVFNIGYLAQCVFCSTVWFTAAVWGLVWFLQPMALPGLVYAVAVAVAWFGALIEATLDAFQEWSDK